MKKIKDAYVKLYPVDGYGNEQSLFQVMAIEKPDALLHFTDPRFWGWLYALEKQIRTRIPLGFLDIWDDIPYPMYNRSFYESCDFLFAISKQSDNINKWVMSPENCCRVNGIYDRDGKLYATPAHLVEIIKRATEKSQNISDTDKQIDIFFTSLARDLNGVMGSDGIPLTFHKIKKHLIDGWPEFCKSFIKPEESCSNGSPSYAEKILGSLSAPIVGSEFRMNKTE